MRTILCFFLVCCLAGCGPKKSSAKNLTGKWRPVSFQSSQVSEMEVRDIIENAKVEFSTDLRFRSYKGNKLQDEGSYSFDEKTQKLTVNNRSEIQVYTVKWSGDTLILDNPLSESMRLVRQ